MLRFKQYLLEYLTDKQRQEYAHTKMTDKARSDTDHFFGKDNDIIHGEIQHDAGHHEHKSEVHRAVERHLGKEIHHDDYHAGVTSDKYGRKVKLGKLIKDEKLRNQFASDSTREGAKKGSVFKTSTVRGTEVAGQTNSSPDHLHPKGHSWGNLSCKNVDDGSNKQYLHREIKHGTIVHRVHDHTGQEIYRATLQPHHNEHGHVAYAVDSEYGIKHPAFSKSAHEVAKKLSGEHKSGIFKKHPDVYNDNDQPHILHPRTNADHLHKALKDEHTSVRRAAASHPNLNSEHLHKALEDENASVRRTAAKHPNANAYNLHKALDDKDEYVRAAAASHPNANAEHLHKALEDKDEYVRAAAASHPNANAEHLHKALEDKDEYVRRTAARHTNANADHLHKALKDKDANVRRAAASHPNLNSEHLHKALEDENASVRRTAAMHSKANADHLHKALDDKIDYVRRAAASHPNANADHLHKALEDKDVGIRSAAAMHLNVNTEHLHKALKDKDFRVREAAASHPNLNK